MFKRIVRFFVFILKVVCVASLVAHLLDLRALVQARHALSLSKELAPTDAHTSRDRFADALALYEWSVVAPGTTSGLAALSRLLRLPTLMVRDPWGQVRADLRATAKLLRGLAAHDRHDDL